MSSIAYYLAVQLQYGDMEPYWHLAYECETHGEAVDALNVLPARYGERARKIVAGRPSGDCRELRPC